MRNISCTESAVKIFFASISVGEGIATLKQNGNGNCESNIVKSHWRTL